MSIVTHSSCTLLHDQCGDVKGSQAGPHGVSLRQTKETLVMGNVEDPSMEQPDVIYTNC